MMLIGVVLLISFICCGLAMGPNLIWTQETTITITEKEYADDTYLVWDTEHNVYRVDDSLIAGRFDSSNAYNRLELNHTYNVKLRGPRAPFLSMYPNIVAFSEVDGA